MVRICQIAFVLAALQACSSASNGAGLPPGEPVAPFPEADARALQQTLDSVVKAAVSPGVSAFMARPGYAAWSGSAGVADLETGTPLTPAARFRAGSMLKTAVATAVLQLVERGALSLDDAITLRLPSEITARIPDAGAITLRMLLEHTSGIPEFVDADFDAAVAADPTHVWTLEEELARALALPPLFAPGAGWAYSNTDYVLLGVIIDRTTGKPWRQVIREQVFAPAGMHASALPEEGNPRCDGCSRGYEPIEGELVDITEVDPSMAGPAGGDALITTPGDLGSLLRALESGRLFDAPQTLELMLDFTDAPMPEWAQTGYGLGLARYDVGGVELIGHLGGTAGFHGFVMLEPSSGVVVSGYMNSGGDFGSFILPFLDAVGSVLARPLAKAARRE